MQKGLLPRLYAVKVISAVNQGGFVEEFFNTADFNELSEKDQRLFNNIACGVLRNREALDFILSQASKKKRIRPKVRHILRVAAFQMFFLDKIPLYAIESTTMDIASALKIDKFNRSFIRAIMTGLIKIFPTKGLVNELLSKQKDEIKYSMPEWIIKYLKKSISEGELSAYLELCNKKPLIRIFAFPGKMTDKELKEKLSDKRINFQEKDEGVIISEFHPFIRSLLHNNLAYVQSECQHNHISMIPVSAGAEVLEIGAAPGGKTISLSTMAGREGKVIACDKSNKRLRLLKNRLKDFSYDNVKVVEGDIIEEPEELKGLFFKYIVVDLPCANLGELAVNPEVRWRLKKEDIISINKIQEKILNKTASYLAKDGFFLMLTCSLGYYEVDQLIDYMTSVLGLTIIKKSIIVPGDECSSGGSGVLFSSK